MERKPFKQFLTKKTPPVYNAHDLQQTVKDQCEYIAWLTEQVEYFLGLLDRQITKEE